MGKKTQKKKIIIINKGKRILALVVKVMWKWDQVKLWVVMFILCTLLVWEGRLK